MATTKASVERSSSAEAPNPGGERTPSQRTRPLTVPQWGSHLGSRGRIVCVTLFLLVAAGVGSWYGGLRYRFVPKRFGVVVPDKVFRSGQSSKWVIEDVLDEHRIRMIIDFNGRDPQDEHQTAEVQAARKRGIPILRFQLSGSGIGDIERYADAVEAILRAEREGKPVLVHCAAGTCRTGAAIGFYRLLIQAWTPAETFDEMQDYGYDREKNRKLGEFMNRNMRPLAEILVERGVLPEMPHPIPQLHL